MTREFSPLVLTLAHLEDILFIWTIGVNGGAVGG